MKLQRHVSKIVGETVYVKHVVTIPPEIVRRLGWKSGREINYDIKKGSLVLS